MTGHAGQIMNIFEHDLFTLKTCGFISDLAACNKFLSPQKNFYFDMKRFFANVYSVCLSSVTLVHPTQMVEIFGNISMAFGTLAIR